jgi:hypothetical protein
VGEKIRILMPNVEEVALDRQQGKAKLTGSKGVPVDVCEYIDS